MTTLLAIPVGDISVKQMPLEQLSNPTMTNLTARTPVMTNQGTGVKVQALARH